MTEEMPVVFVGHGSPMNAIADSRFSQAWRALGRTLPRPAAVLCVSAHWETWGTAVTAMPWPRTIHDFGGFPPELFAVEYPAPESAEVARAVQAALAPASVGLDRDWGLDHGAWSVLRNMYPAADVPVVQLSLDIAMTPQAHYDLARALAPLRQAGILVLGSGNMVHNLFRVALPTGRVSDFNEPFGLDWALVASATFKRLIDAGDHAALIDYPALGEAVEMAVPTPEHYLPMLYALALQRPGEPLTYFNDVAVAGSLTMTSFVIGQG